MGIDVDQLRQYVVGPTLSYIGLHSEAAVNLVIGTALVESRGEYIKQIGSGPALGLWQMEPATHDDIWDNFLAYKDELAFKVKGLDTIAAFTRGSKEMLGNLYYGAAMCRLHYYRRPEALPGPHDVFGLASYWKEYYNTHLGAGTVEKAIPYFEEACRD